VRRKRRGHARLGRVETGLLARAHSHWNQGACQSTQGVPPDRRDALCPSPKIQKQAAFGIIALVPYRPHEKLRVGADRFLKNALLRRRNARRKFR